MDSLHYLIYVSHAKIDIHGPEPQAILNVGRSRNAALSVTGLLIFSGDHFAQWLEGSVDALEKLMRSIRADERHTILHEWPMMPISQRHHGQWALGYLYDGSLEDWLSLYDDPTQDAPPLQELIENVFLKANVA